MEPLRLGLVGLGGMGQGHLAKEMSLAEVSFVGVADLVPEVVESTSAKYGMPGFNRYEQLIDSGRCEAVLIAAPHPYHAPIAVTVREADGMIEAAERAGVTFGVMFQTRTEAHYRKARELLTEGAIGPVYRTVMVASHWFRSQAYYDSGSWRGTWTGEGGGVLMNQSPHSLDIFIWLGGKPTRVQARTSSRFHLIEVEDTAEALLEYGQGQTGYLYTTTAEWPGEDRIEFTGENGKLIVQNGQIRLYRLSAPIREVVGTTTIWGKPDGAWGDIPIEPTEFGHAAVVRQFARAIRYGEPLIATGDDGRNSLELANAILLSGHESRPVDLPIDRDKYEHFLATMRQGSLVK